MIDGQPYLPFKGTRCANNLDTSGVVKPQVQVSWQLGTDASKAACRAFDFFQDFNCNGKLLGSFPDGKSRTMTLPGTVKSARCIIGASPLALPRPPLLLSSPPFPSSFPLLLSSPPFPSSFPLLFPLLLSSPPFLSAQSRSLSLPLSRYTLACTA
ncbi:unnamed protein product [Closterium sp. Naga37s-1]|nr:unnamed protein product [Closterium sp. Naga37s-1]